LGAALLAAVGTGLVTHDTAQTGWSTLIERARPDAARVARYAEYFDVYTALYPALMPSMHRLQSI
jgi:xylulokinase